MSKRRIVLLIAVCAIAWSSVGASMVFGADEERPGGTTGANYVQNKYIWVGDTSRYGQVGVLYHLEVMPGTIVYARWECSGGNGPTDSMNGGVNGGEWDVSGADFDGAHIVLSSADTYCAYHVWRYSGSGGFRIVSSMVQFWNQEFEGGGPGNPAPSGTAGPGTSVSGPSPTPSPSPSAPPCPSERTVIIDGTPTDFIYRVITYCPENTGNIVDRQWVGGVGCVDQFTTGRPYGGAYQFTAAPAEPVAYVRAAVDSASPMAPSGGGAHAMTVHDMASGTWDGIQLTATVDSPHAVDLLGGTHTNFEVWYQGRGLTSGHSYNVRTDGDTCDAGPGVGTFHIEFGEVEVWLGPTFPSSPGQPWEGSDITPTPSPSPSPSGGPSATPSPTAPPPPPVGYFSPLPGIPSPGPNLGGSEGLVDPSPQPHNPTGIAECDDDDGTFSKVGQAPLQPLNDTSFPGSINPLDYLPWLGNMMANVPIVIGNTAQWATNTGVDFVVPGDCVADIITEQQTALFAEGPLSVYEDVRGQVESAIAATASGASAGDCTFEVPLPGGGGACIPFASWAASVSGVRNFLVVGIWFFTLIGVYRIIVGAFRVAKADIEDGRNLDTWLG